ncbi:type 2 periplasmic-binding domain-containing protein [Burkholderia pseudomallei]|uniref:aldo/keto reductase n=1 Tax=Burkholderia pseudomallei TaxID=28450 RepID=UPI001E2A13A2|nr:aldo/keto reductase [Burkholderia pseudomallei]
MSLPVSLGRRRALPALLDVAQRHPLLRLDLSFTDRRSDLVDEGIDRAVRIGDPGGAAARALRAAASAAGVRRRARRPLISRGAAGLGAVARARGVARARRAAGGLAIACRRTVFRNRV